MVFDSYPEMKAAIDDENLDITPDHVLVLRGAGPQGGPGMPEWGMLPMPKVLLKKDIATCCAFRRPHERHQLWSCVLHVSPESHVGGPLALAENGRIVAARPKGAQDRHAGGRR